MRVLILGASGLVGGNCYHHFKDDLKWEVLGTHFSFPTDYTIYVDTTSDELLQNLEIENFRPEVIIHAGALTHVDLCEQEPQKSHLLTVETTRNAVALAKKHNAIFVYVSTDYVFDGKNGPYTESASIHPLSVYGSHKLEAERLVQDIDNHIIIRITNVYGDELRNKNFVSRLAQNAIQKEIQTLRLPSDQYATPINAFDIAKALKLLLIDKQFGIWHLASTDYFNRVQLAKKVLEHFPSDGINIEPVLTKSMNQPANRPLYGGLLAHKFLSKYPDFEFSNVDSYLLGVKMQLD